MALTYEDVYEYVGIEAEFADDMQQRRAERALRASQQWLMSAVGKRCDLEDPWGWMEWPLAEETILMAAGELYEDRTLSDTNLSKYAGSKVAASLRRLAFDALSQLRHCEPPELPSSEPDEPAEEPEQPEEGDDGCPSETP